MKPHEDTEFVSVLLVSDNKYDTEQIKSHLAKTMGVACSVTHCDTIAKAGRWFEGKTPEVDLVLLDLHLIAGGKPQEIFGEMQQMALGRPIIVITERRDHALALLVVEAGASDNVTRGEFSSDPFKLRDAIQFALARHRSTSKLAEVNAGYLTRISETNLANLRQAEQGGQAEMQKLKDEAVASLKELRVRAALLIEKNHTISWLSGGYFTDDIANVHKS